MDRLTTTNKIIAAVITCSVIIWFVHHRTSKRLPPGPRPLPLIGNTRQVPRTYPWLTYSTWAKAVWYARPSIYFQRSTPNRASGDIVYFTAAGHHMVVLNTPHAVRDLFDKRSVIYSG